MDRIDQIIANCRRDSRTVSGSERRALCDEVERLRRELQAATVPTDSPGDMARCTECGRGLLFSCREMKTGLCHVCGHKAYAALIQRLPQTADGVPIHMNCPVERVWSIADGEPYDIIWANCDTLVPNDGVYLEDLAGYGDWLHKCYSTREAALKAIAAQQAARDK